MKKEYETLILEHDKTLSFLRKEWMSADTSRKASWWEKINAALDEQLRLMKVRDTFQP